MVLNIHLNIQVKTFCRFETIHRSDNKLFKTQDHDPHFYFCSSQGPFRKPGHHKLEFAILHFSLSIVKRLGKIKSTSDILGNREVQSGIGEATPGGVY